MKPKIRYAGLEDVWEGVRIVAIGTAGVPFATPPHSNQIWADCTGCDQSIIATFHSTERAKACSDEKITKLFNKYGWTIKPTLCNKCRLKAVKSVSATKKITETKLGRLKLNANGLRKLANSIEDVYGSKSLVLAVRVWQEEETHFAEGSEGEVFLQLAEDTGHINLVEDQGPQNLKCDEECDELKEKFLNIYTKHKVSDTCYIHKDREQGFLEDMRDLYLELKHNKKHVCVCGHEKYIHGSYTTGNVGRCCEHEIIDGKLVYCKCQKYKGAKK